LPAAVGVAARHDEPLAGVLVEREEVDHVAGAPLLALERRGLLAVGDRETLLDRVLVPRRQMGLAHAQAVSDLDGDHESRPSSKASSYSKT
jgi:hypothetical protein